MSRRRSSRKVQKGGKSQKGGLTLPLSRHSRLRKHFRPWGIVRRKQTQTGGIFPLLALIPAAVAAAKAAAGAAALGAVGASAGYGAKKLIKHLDK